MIVFAVDARQKLNMAGQVPTSVENVEGGGDAAVTAAQLQQLPWACVSASGARVRQPRHKGRHLYTHIHPQGTIRAGHCCAPLVGGGWATGRDIYIKSPTGERLAATARRARTKRANPPPPPIHPPTHLPTRPRAHAHTSVHIFIKPSTNRRAIPIRRRPPARAAGTGPRTSQSGTRCRRSRPPPGCPRPQAASRTPPS